MAALGPRSAGAEPALVEPAVGAPPHVSGRGGPDLHAALFGESRYPAAAECAACHPRQYEQWSASQHAYTMVSPVFNAMHGRILQLTNGSLGDFCIRCHTPVGMALGEPVFAEYASRHPTSQEGVTCVVCHRVDQPFGKFSARMPLTEGDLNEPVYGPTGNEELARVLASEEYGVVTDPTEGPGRPVHARAERFFQIVEPGFCGRCHDVTQADGFRLEEAFSEYKSSPAAKAGRTCQNCHMGVVPGDPASGRDFGPAAIVGGRPTRPRSLSNHLIVGPDHSVVHPALFPQSTAIREVASLDEWLLFDWRAGWGTDAFEDSVSPEATFPARWSSVDARYDARELIDSQLARLREANERRLELLRRGYVLGEVVVEKAEPRRLRFRVEVRNGVDTHNVPTGFTAERLVFLRIAVTDASGQVVFRSGDLDANGDVRDLHSLQVVDGEVPLDRQLFSLQSKFLTRNVRGGEREQVLAVNQSLDALPFLRPDPRPTVLSGRPANARIHKQGIEPGGRRWARYELGRRQLTGRPPYELDVQLVAAMVPVNLVQAIQGAGFDFGLSAAEVAERIVEGHVVLARRRVPLLRAGAGAGARERSGG